MSIRLSNKRRNQTSWKFGETYFYANIPEEIKDLKVIEDAKSIVDHALPQRFGPWGTEYYSHLSREYVLNLILYFYKDQTRFPHMIFVLRIIGIGKQVLGEVVILRIEKEEEITYQDIGFICPP